MSCGSISGEEPYLVGFLRGGRVWGERERNGGGDGGGAFTRTFQTLGVWMRGAEVAFPPEQQEL